EIGLAQQYMFAAMGVVRAAYCDRIANLYARDEALAVMRSVDKLFDVELALMLRSYQVDSEERLVARERLIQADRITALRTLSARLAHEGRHPPNAAQLQPEPLQPPLPRPGGDREPPR